MDGRARARTRRFMCTEYICMLPTSRTSTLGHSEDTKSPRMMRTLSQHTRCYYDHLCNTDCNTYRAHENNLRGCQLQKPLLADGGHQGKPALPSGMAVVLIRPACRVPGAGASSHYRLHKHASGYQSCCHPSYHDMTACNTSNFQAQDT